MKQPDNNLSILFVVVKHKWIIIYLSVPRIATLRRGSSAPHSAAKTGCEIPMTKTQVPARHCAATKTTLVIRRSKKRTAAPAVVMSVALPPNPRSFALRQSPAGEAQRPLPQWVASSGSQQTLVGGLTPYSSIVALSQSALIGMSSRSAVTAKAVNSKTSPPRNVLVAPRKLDRRFRNKLARNDTSPVAPFTRNPTMRMHKKSCRQYKKLISSNPIKSQ